MNEPNVLLAQMFVAGMFAWIFAEVFGCPDRISKIVGGGAAIAMYFLESKPAQAAAALYFT